MSKSPWKNSNTVTMFGECGKLALIQGLSSSCRTENMHDGRTSLFQSGFELLPLCATPDRAGRRGNAGT